MKSSISVIFCCAFGMLLHLHTETKVPEDRASAVPRIPNSSLLIGSSPFFLMATNARKDIRLQPEPAQPEVRDATSLYPSISQDGKTIAYARVKAGRPERAVAISTYSTTTDAHTEYATGNFTGSTSISPDASKLVYADAIPVGQLRRGEDEFHLHIVNLETRHVSLGPRISDPRWPVFVSWSPDSRRLVFGDASEIRVWDSDTGRVWKIADGDLPAWSPSGEWIAYLPGSWDRALGRVVFSSGRWGPKCFLVHPDGSGQKTIVDLTKSKYDKSFVEPPVWSPDSKKILLNEMDNVEANTASIDEVDVQTLKLKTLFKNSYHVLGWALDN